MPKTKQLPLIKIGVLIVLPLVFLSLLIFFKPDGPESQDSPVLTDDLPITPLDAANLQQMLTKAAAADFVLLGEASHGTSEYYYWRKKISQELIQNHDFSFIAVEGDWAPLHKVNQYVKHLSNDNLLNDELIGEELTGGELTGRQILKTFDRWPVWMWSNEEFLELVEWLRDYNRDLPLEERVGVYGKDVYGIESSAPELIEYLMQADSPITSQAQQAYDCLLQYQGDYNAYLDSVFNQNQSCEDQIAAVTDYLQENKDHYQELTSEQSFLNALQNALVVQNGEHYYRLTATQGPASWNSRVDHMAATVGRLTDFYQADGQTARGIVWAHNTHVGDARATEMAGAGMSNIGQILRGKHGREKVFIVGFSTYQGEVAAGHAWGSPLRIMNVPPAREGSLEDLLNQQELDSFILFLDEPLPELLQEPIGHRAKGVVYSPANDRNQYVATLLPERYDAFIFISQTKALQPLNVDETQE